jgi:hypothetical protein
VGGGRVGGEGKQGRGRDRSRPVRPQEPQNQAVKRQIG